MMTFDHDGGAADAAPVAGNPLLARRVFVGGSMLALLSACGGSPTAGTVTTGGGGTSVTPTPSPSPSTTPTPTATGSLVPPLQTGVIATSVARLFLTQQVATPLTVTAADASLGEPNTMSIGYDATSGAYTVTGTGGTGSGAAFTDVFATSTLAASDGTLKLFRKTVNARQTTLYLLDNAAGNRLVQLAYTSFANHITVDTGTNTNAVEFRTLMGGIKTPSLPSSGTRRYQMTIDGYVVDGGKIYRVLGNRCTVTADFATGSVISSAINLTGNTDLSGARQGETRTFGVGTINCHIRSGNARIHSDNHVEYLFSGDFFGPNLEEAGITFMIRSVANLPIIAMSLVGVQIAA